jgi:glycerol-3-phosphate acyltransferase PlsX
MRVAVDAMGGDHAPAHIVEGAVQAAREGSVPLLLVGPREEVEAELERYADAGALDIEVADAPVVLGMDEPPTRVLRSKRDASICVAVQAATAGGADAVFSAGHSGASVIAALSGFGLLPGIDRPALATTLPTISGAAILLDAGANVECRPLHLVQFAFLGAAYARAALGLQSPRVALLSIGEEASKGNDLIREAHRQLKGTELNFCGNIEADDLYRGQADVIVCDGFTGNVALKVSEGMVEAIEQLLHEELSRNLSTRFGALLWRPAFDRFRQRVDYAEYGAAPVLGVRGVCLVGHGRSSARAVRNGVLLAARFAGDDLAGRVGRDLAAAAMPVAPV